MHNLNAYAKGRMGEERACEYLQEKGMVLLAKRYRSLYGEIDLIMRDGRALVFVEVKTRERGPKGTGLLAITPVKKRRLLQTASLYLAEHGMAQAIRFDAVEITAKGITHIQNAFDATDAGW